MVIAKIIGKTVNNFKKNAEVVGKKVVKELKIDTQKVKIKLERSPKEDFIIIDLKPENQFKSQVQKHLFSPKLRNDCGWPYSPEEIEDIMRRTRIDKEEDVVLFNTLLDSDTPKFSLDEISLIMNRKNGNNTVLYSDKWCEDFAKKFKTGSAFTDIIIKSKISNLGYLIGQNIKDSIIGKAVIDKIIELRGIGDIHYDGLKKELDSLINLVEIDSSARNFSYPLMGDSYKYTRLSRESAEHSRILNELTQSPGNQKLSNYEARLFQNEIELDPLKSYLADNSESDAGLSKYLYDTYYIPRLSPKTKMICQKISDEFGTKLFVENESNPNAAQMVYKELSQWQRASKGEFLKPLTINLSRYDSYYVKLPKIGGYMYDFNKSVHVKKDSIKPMTWALRHELVHLNDNKFYEESGIINGIDVDKIIVREPEETDGTVGDLIWDKCLYKEELFNGGLAHEKIKYAYTDKNEFIAVASEGDYSKYSPEFRDVLVKLGLPKYVFDMKPNNPEFVKNAKEIAEMKQENKNLKFHIAY